MQIGGHRYPMSCDILPPPQSVAVRSGVHYKEGILCVMKEESPYQQELQ